MGCGLSVDKAHPNRHFMANTTAPESWAQSVAIPQAKASNNEYANQVLLDKKVLEEYMRVERSMADAQREQPELLPNLRSKLDQLKEVEQKLTQPAGSAAGEQQLNKQRDQLRNEVDQLQVKAEKLEMLQAEQDQLLAKMFGSSYSSELEVALEQQLHVLEGRRARIMEANFKWRQAQMMMEYACRQLAVAVQKWQDLPEIPTIELEIRYTIPNEARSRMTDGMQLTDHSGAYDDDMGYPGDDVYDPEAARKQLQLNHAKATSLLSWFEQVLNTTIIQDLASINTQLRQTALSLRQERLRIIRQKVHEIWGDDVQVEIDEQTVDGSHSKELDEPYPAVTPDDKIMELLEAGDLSDLTLGDLELAAEGGASGSELFGKSYEEFKQELDQMRNQHEQEMGQFLREQDRLAAKTRGDLQAKLEARRRFRAMKNLENKQRQQLRVGKAIT